MTDDYSKIKVSRIILIVLDGAGVGALPDAADFGDEGSNTLANIARVLGGLHLPNLEAMGLGNLGEIIGIPSKPDCHAAYGVMHEASNGKDTVIGHWEMMGIITDRPFPVYPNGFPDDIIIPFEEIIGSKIIGNISASGTEIIEQLGPMHMQTGSPIVYTSADSVFQIAAHESVISVNELYEICLKARNLLVGQHNVARVIARPFVGEPGNFTRTYNRKDFPILPPKPTVIEYIHMAGFNVTAIGKICDIFSGKGIDECIHTEGNLDGIENIIDKISSVRCGLIFANLVDFDSKYGHRNDPVGFANGLIEFDDNLPQIKRNMKENDLLIITADHGVDPTTKSTDHSREKVPLLIWHKGIQPTDLGVRSSFSDIAATISDLFFLKYPCAGVSFADKIF